MGEDELTASCACLSGALAQSDLVALDLLTTPVWVFDTQRRCIWWANRAALTLWNAADLDELLARDFAGEMSDVTAARLREYLRRFRAGETVLEQWTIYPRGHPQTVDCTCSGVRIEDGRMAMLVEARPPAAQAATGDALRESERKYRTLIEHNPAGFLLLAANGEIRELNPALCDMLGHSRGSLIGRNAAELMDPSEQAGFRARLDAAAQGSVVALEVSLRHATDGSVPVQLVLAILPDQLGARRCFAFVTDLSERKRVQASLEKLSRAMEHSGSAVMITDADGRIEYVNPQFTRLTGYTPAEVHGRNPSMLGAGDMSAAASAELWRSIATGDVWRGEVHNRRKDGSLYWTLLTIAPMKDAAGGIHRYVGVSEDVTALKEAHERAEKLSRYDGLTGLANRRLFAERLTAAVRAARDGAPPAALLFLDLDGFKEINDTLGHEVGDRVLCQVAQRLGDGLRDGDTLARLGGDEFAVLLPGLGETEDAEAVAAKVLRLLERPLELPGLQRPLGASIGIALMPRDGADADQLLRNADLAMYSAKSGGRGQYRVFREHMHRSLSARVQTAQELRNALAEEELTLFYQPVLRLADMTVVGAEALVRWQHPRRGLVLPEAFIGVAEETGLSAALGERVLRLAGADLLNTLAATPLQWISINVSARQLRSAEFAHSLHRLLLTKGVTPARLKLELSETALVQNGRPDHAALERLGHLGVGLAVDDFGTGWSSMAYLKQVSVDSLKVDQSFVQSLPAEANDRAITTAVLAMARALGISVIAEGIDSAEQLTVLRALGCEYGQGFLLGRPMPAAQLASWLRGRSPPQAP